LFNARLCGIMAGIQIAMIALLVMGARLPIPWPLALSVVALPVVGYMLVGVIVPRMPAEWRTTYLVGAISLNAGLLGAAASAILGLLDPTLLLAVTAALMALLWRPLRRAIHAAPELNRSEEERATEDYSD
jgi:hypothetical protein